LNLQLRRIDITESIAIDRDLVNMKEYRVGYLDVNGAVKLAIPQNNIFGMVIKDAVFDFYVPSGQDLNRSALR